MTVANKHHRIPLWLKVLYTLYTCAAIWVNRSAYGVTDFLWFSDIALILTVPALWLESSLLSSMMAVAIVLPETGWGVAFLCRLFSGIHLGGVTAYMFKRVIPLDIRAISLFHLFLPVLLVWMVHRLGYDRRAVWVQTIFCWLIYLLTFFCTKPGKNIDWAFGPGGKPQSVMPAWLYLWIIMLLMPLCVYVPTHWILRTLFRQPRGSK